MVRWLIYVSFFIILVAREAIAQGSFGDAVFVNDFGAGAVFGLGPKLSDDATTYQYDANTCPPDGKYTITSRLPTGCFNNAWHIIAEDHTPGDENGYMMVVNAESSPGLFYTFTVDNLCPNTTYEFASWMINPSKTTCGGQPTKQPDITFRIETENGDLIKEQNTGNIPPVSNLPEWKQYGTIFTTPADVSKIVLKMINAAPGGCGNDIIIDDITFRPYGPDIQAGSSASIEQNSFIICEGTSRNYSFSGNVSTGYTNPTYQWQVNNHDGTGWSDIMKEGNSQNLNVNISNAEMNGYSYRLTIAEGSNINISSCRIASEPIVITVVPVPVADAGEEKNITIGESVSLTGTVTGLYKEIYWTPAVGTQDNLNPVVSPLEDTRYVLNVITNEDCHITDDVWVKVKKKIPIVTTVSVLKSAVAPKTEAIVIGEYGFGQEYLTVASGGIVWSTDPNPVVESSNTITNYNEGNISAVISDLTPGTKYYVKTWVTIQNEIIYGHEVEFVTDPLVMPEIATHVVSQISYSTAVGNGEIIIVGDANVIERGFVWHQQDVPDINFNIGRTISDNSEPLLFTAALQGLEENTRYYIRSYVISSLGVFYGGVLSFMTLSKPYLTVNSTEIKFSDNCYESIPEVMSYKLSGLNLYPSEGNVIIIAPQGFGISLQETADFAQSIEVEYVNSMLEDITIYVRLNTNSVGSFSGKLLNKAIGSEDVEIEVSGNIQRVSITPGIKGPDKVCISSDEIQYYDDSLAEPNYITAWLWTFDDGTTSSEQHPKHRWATAGKHKVTLQISTVGACEDVIATHETHVYSLPDADFTISGVLCENTEVVFTNISLLETDAEPIKWGWDFGDGTSSLVSSFSNKIQHIYSEPGIYTIKHWIQNSEGCLSNIITKTITINPSPEIDFYMPDDICVTAEELPFNGINKNQSLVISSWYWDFGDGNTSTTQNPLHNYEKGGVYSVRVTGKTATGCEASVIKEVKVYDVPKVAFEIENQSLCSISPVKITNKSSIIGYGGIKTIEIYWDYLNNPDMKQVDEFPETGKVYEHKYANSTDTEVTYRILLKVFNEVGCVETSYQNITIHAIPAAELDALPAICVNETAFNLTQGRDSRKLSGSGIYSGNGITQSPEFSPKQAGPGVHKIKYTYTSDNGCVSEAEQYIEVYANPVIAVDEDVIYVKDNESVTLSPKVISGGNNLTYKWSPSTYLDNAYVQTPISRPLEDITYTLIVENENGCKEELTVAVNISKELLPPNTFTPNGDNYNDVWEVKYLEIYKDATVSIYNRYGKKVFSSTKDRKVWDGKHNGEDLPTGTYYYIIDLRNGEKPISGSVTIVR